MSSDRQPPFAPQESLSAAMDGASHELELRRVLAACAGNAEMRQRWSRYHVISAAIQKQPLALHDSLVFADAVRSAIDAENSHTQSNGKVFVRLAVAASVALVVIVGARWQQSVSSGTAQQLAGSMPTVEQQPLSESKALTGVPSSLGVVNIFARSDDARLLYTGVKTQFENASMSADITKTPFIRAAEKKSAKK